VVADATVAPVPSQIVDSEAEYPKLQEHKLPT